VPLSRALTLIEREAANANARALWSDIHHRVRDGAGLAEAMAAQQGVFPVVFIAMVRAGETGGFLDTVLEQIADYLERQRELRGKVSAALIYPALLATVASAVVTFLLLWFIPRFAELFASFDQELPLITRIIQGLSHELLQHGWILLLAVASLVLGLQAFARHPRGALHWQRFLTWLPGLGSVKLLAARVRFCRMLGTLLKAGVPLLGALDVARQTVGNLLMENALIATQERVRQGESLSRALDSLGALLPDAAREILAVAESSGRMPEELLRLADTGEHELDRRLRSLVALAEPLMLMLMAAIVGCIVIGMLLPIFDLWGAVS
jgi:type II secretory pathway component PulF